jgi:hypothetical protein
MHAQLRTQESRCNLLRKKAFKPMNKQLPANAELLLTAFSSSGEQLKVGMVFVQNMQFDLV